MSPIAWNTGRLYTEFGQRIGACVAKLEGSNTTYVFFTDIDRGIDGRIILSSYDRLTVFRSDRELREFVMFMYDRCLYDNPSFEQNERTILQLLWGAARKVERAA